MDKLYIVCVLYNKKVEEISSLSTFLYFVDKYDSVRLKIMDNSSEAIAAENRETCETVYKNRITYTCSGGNIGLSKAYNKALDEIEDDTFYVMWSDDDTTFSKEYIGNVLKMIKLGRSDIIAGIIMTKNGVLSPAAALSPLLIKSRKKFIQKPGLYNNIYCINSGLTIKNTVFDAVGRYDEELFLDAVDHLFCDKLIDKGINRIAIVPGDIMQDYSGQTNDLPARKKRLRILMRDWLKWKKISQRHTVFIYLFLLSEIRSLLKAVLKNTTAKVIDGK